MNEPLSSEVQQLLSQQLATGEYSSADEVLLEAVRLLAERNRCREELRRQIQIGRDQLDRGEFAEYDDDALRERFEQLKQRAEERVDRNRQST
jgi:antitoxin ParD1/3/4